MGGEGPRVSRAEARAGGRRSGRSGVATFLANADGPMRWRTGPSIYQSCVRCSGRDDMPDVVAVVAVEVARLLVVLPEIDRLALVGPLLAALVTGGPGPAC